jgi:ketosteroid isomerase-like protein
MIEPNFTGSRSQHEPTEHVKASVPFRIVIKIVDDITAGKVTRTYFEWVVELRGNRIASRNVYNDSQPKTRKAAIRQARRAIREWCLYIHS